MARYDVTFRIVCYPIVNVEAEDENEAEDKALAAFEYNSALMLEDCRCVQIVQEGDEEYHTETYEPVYQTVD